MYKDFFYSFFFFIIQLFTVFLFNAEMHYITSLITSFLLQVISNLKIDFRVSTFSHLHISEQKKVHFLVSNTNVLYTPFTRLLLCIRMSIPATIFIFLWLIHGLLILLDSPWLTLASSVSMICLPIADKRLLWFNGYLSPYPV